MLLRLTPVVLLALPCPSQSLVISEFMAANSSTLADEDGNTSDWLELFNATPKTVDLGGWFLTDDRGNPKKWAFPKPTRLAAGRFLVLFASGKARAVSGNQLHTNFKLDRVGEYLGLFDPAGKLVFDFGASYPRQYIDIPFGLEFNPGVTQKRSYFRWGSPWRTNGLGAAMAGDVTHSPAILKSGTDSVVTANVLNPSNAKINSVLLKYRVDYLPEAAVAMRDDGKAPDPIARDGKWTGAITSSRYTAGQMVRWRIETSIQGGNKGTVPVFVSTIRSPEFFGTLVADPRVKSDIPVFYWWAEQPWRAATTQGTRCSVYYSGEFYDNVGVRSRGGSSKSYPKQSFKFDFNPSFHLRFDPKEGRVEEVNLNTTYADKAFIRQVLSYETLRDAGAESSITFPVRQQQNGRFYMVSIFTEQVDRDYLEREGLDPGGALYKVYNPLTTASTTRNEKKTRKREGFADLQALVNNIRIAGQARNRYLWDNVDIPACINYWACIVLMHDNDCVHKNYYVYRDSDGDGEWRFLPWDKDLTFGRNFFRGVLNDTIWAERDPQSHPLFGNSAHQKIDRFYNRLVHALMAEPRIRRMYLRRLRTLMDGLLNDPSTPVGQRYYEKRIAVLQQQVSSSAALDKAKWGVPAYGNRTLDFAKAVRVLIDNYLSRRRRHLFKTHSANPGGIIPPAQPRSGLAVSFGRVDANKTRDEQFVEIVNTNEFALDISDWRVRGGGIDFTFPGGAVVDAGSPVFVTANPKVFRARKTAPTGGMGLFVLGPFRGTLLSRVGLALYDDRGLPTAQTGAFPYSLSTTGGGDVRILVSQAAPRSHLWILFSLDNSGPPGSGPFLGLGNDVLWQVGLPLGTAPIHVLTDARGSYAFAAPKNTVATGVQFTSRAAYVDGATGQIVLSEVRRVKF